MDGRIGRTGLVVLWVVNEWHRQQAELGCQHLEQGLWHIAHISQETVPPAQRTELYTEPQLVARAAALGDLPEIAVGEREVLAQARPVDLSWHSLSRVLDGQGLFLRLSLEPGGVWHCSVRRAHHIRQGSRSVEHLGKTGTPGCQGQRVVVSVSLLIEVARLAIEAAKVLSR